MTTILTYIAAYLIAGIPMTLLSYKEHIVGIVKDTYPAVIVFWVMWLPILICKIVISK